MVFFQISDQLQQVGLMEINQVNNLSKLAGNKATSSNTPSLADIDDISDEEQGGRFTRFHFGYLLKSDGPEQY